MRRAAAALVLLSATALAGETEHAEIRFSRGTFSYAVTSLIDGSSEDVRAVVTDYDRLHRINPHIIESRLVERYGPNEVKRVLRMKYCILVFCFDLDFVERVRETPGRIVTTIIPEESSFDDGMAEWQIETVDERHTRVTVSATQTPGFWIPPVIGPLILKRVFLKEISATCTNIERVIQTMETGGA